MISSLGQRNGKASEEKGRPVIFIGSCGFYYPASATIPFHFFSDSLLWGPFKTFCPTMLSPGRREDSP